MVSSSQILGATTEKTLAQVKLSFTNKQLILDRWSEPTSVFGTLFMISSSCCRSLVMWTSICLWSVLSWVYIWWREISISTCAPYWDLSVSDSLASSQVRHMDYNGWRQLDERTEQTKWCPPTQGTRGKKWCAPREESRGKKKTQNLKNLTTATIMIALLVTGFAYMNPLKPGTYTHKAVMSLQCV